MHRVLRRTRPTKPCPTRLQNLHELRRVNRPPEETHGRTHEQIKLYVVHRPDHAQTTQPQAYNVRRTSNGNTCSHMRRAHSKRQGRVATTCRPMGIPSMDRMLLFVEIKK